MNDLLNLDLGKFKSSIVEAFTAVYGEQYRIIIKDRVYNSIILQYNDTDGLNNYLILLKDIKKMQLLIDFLSQIGYDVTEYKKMRPVDLLENSRIIKLGSIYLGFINNWFKNDTSVPIRSFNQIDIPNYDLINEIYKNKIITSKNYDNFIKTKEYLEIENKIKECNLIYDNLVNRYQKYEQSLSVYQEYIDEEIQRKKKIFDNGRKRIIDRIYPFLTDYLKEKFNVLSIDEIKKIVFQYCQYYDFTNNLNFVYFDKESMDALYSDDVELNDKRFVNQLQISYFKNFDIDLPDQDILKFRKQEDVDAYLKFLEQDNIKKLIPKQDAINKMNKIYEEEANNCMRKYIVGRDDFKRIIQTYSLGDEYYDWLLSYLKNVKICVTWDGCQANSRYMPIMFYTIRQFSLGRLANIFIHEFGHVIDEVEKKGCGFERKNDDKTVNPYDKTRRKYEIMNEAINDIFTIEAEKFLNKNGIYLLETKSFTKTNKYNENTSLLTKNILKPLIDRYREYVIKAKISADRSILSNYIGEDNFEQLNDIVNKIEFLSQKGLQYDLRSNVKSREVKEYNEHLEKVKKIYLNIDEYITNNNNYDYWGIKCK